MASTLKELEVERNDAVDQPATRKKWLIIKAKRTRGPRVKKSAPKMGEGLFENVVFGQ